MATGAGDGESTASFLRGVALFAELTDDLRRELALAAERVDLPAGEWLFRQGDPADGLYVVSAGRLEVVHEDPEPQVIRVLSVGESVAEVGDGSDRDHALAQAYSAMLDRCERDHDWVVLVASDASGNEPWTRFCLRASDRVVAVADPAAGPPPTELPDAVAGCDLLVWSSHADAGLLLPWLERLAPRAHHFIGPPSSPSRSIARAGRRLVGGSLGRALSGRPARRLD